MLAVIPFLWRPECEEPLRATVELALKLPKTVAGLCIRIVGCGGDVFYKTSVKRSGTLVTTSITLVIRASAHTLRHLPKACKQPETAYVHKTVYLSIGSNLGDRAANVTTAIEHLGQFGDVKAVSSFYETEPVDYAAQPWFVNCAVALDTELMPRQFLSRLQSIEQTMGRRRTHSKGPRLIDLDILLFGNTVMNLPNLIIPHPEMHERRFVLEPLAEIAADVRHPIFRKTIRQLRDDLPPAQKVKRLST
jgi:2-amino-4-hydroxy-6-hydroxymethyldihydropteridine diphosphokinase